MTAAEAQWQAVRSLLQARRDEPPLMPLPRDAERPASFAQEALWLVDQLQPGGTAFNLAVVCRFTGALDVTALAHSLDEVRARHETLRTTLHSVGARLVQCVAGAGDRPLVAESVAARDLEAWIAARTNAPFDLSGGPLLRVALARVGAAEHHLVIVVHHAVFDAWSFEIFMDELSRSYAAHTTGQTLSLPAAALQYGDWAAWQRRQLDGPARNKLVEHWKSVLREMPRALELPGRARPRIPAPRRAAIRQATFARELADAIEALAARQQTTPYVVLLAAFQVLLHRYTGEHDVIVGTPVAGRTRTELDGIIGLFSNLVPIRADLGGEPTFREVLGRVAEAVSAALSQHTLPFELLVKELRVPRVPGCAPLFEVLFAFQNVPRKPATWPGLDVEMRYVPPSQAKLDLTLTMQRTAEGFSALVEYDADRFDEGWIARLVEHFGTLLAGIVHEPDSRIDELPLLSFEQRNQLLVTWNNTKADYPRDSAVHRLFEAQARRGPDAVAVSSGLSKLTYGALNRRANQLARHLVAHGVGDETLVGVLLDREPSLIVVLLAILKAGAAYVPLDVTAPRERVKQLLARAAVVVTSARHADRLEQTGLRIMVVEEAAVDREPEYDLERSFGVEQLAYVMFTSGSTGTPRGVCVPHRGVVRLVHGGYARFAADETFLQHSPIAFDASTFEIWAALLHGATLVLAPPGPLGLEEIAAVIRQHRVTTLWLTSGLFELFVDDAVDSLGSVRQLLTGGDVVSPRHAQRFLQRHPRCRLIHCYGPTENTTFSTTYDVERTGLDGALPIGRPIANSTIHVVDAGGEPVPLGVVGEAWVGGDGIALGYLDDPIASRARFIADQFTGHGRLYRTGDLVRRRGDGTLEFVGRVDAQVKVRGVRVDPEEVAHVIRQCPGVRSAVVVAEGQPGHKRLLAYVVSNVPDEALTASVRSFLRARLPDAMMPSAIVVVDAWPLTGNGKLDRRALPAPQSMVESPPNAARDALEARLVVLFSATLDRRAVGIHDNFFDLGGDSLSAMRLTVEIERELGTELPLATVFAHATVAALARELRPRAALRLHHDTIATVKAGRSARPLFLMAGGRGGRDELAIYAKLVTRLDPDETVYGMTVPAGETVEAFAARHIEVLRAVQPRGPYRIGGECVGGVVAFEIARQLVAAGESIALLLLMDSWCPSGIGVLYHRLVGQPLELMTLGLQFLADLSRRPPSNERWWTELLRRAHVAPEGKRYIRACMRYRPQAYGGPITLLASEANLRRGIADDWRRLARRGVSVFRAPGNHQTYSRQHGDATAAQLRRCLEQSPIEEIH